MTHCRGVKGTLCVYVKTKRSHALTHDKNKPTNEHTNEQNGQRRNDRLTVEDAVAAPKIVVVFDFEFPITETTKL